MHRVLPTVGVAAALALSAAPLSAQFGRRSEPPKLEHFYYDNWTFDSEHAAGGEVRYSIYLPKEHDHEKNKDRKFPWILWCPGFGGPDDFQTRGGASTLDRLRGADKIPELALVVFRAPGRRSRTTYMNGEAGGDIEDLIVEDLVRHLEGRYRLGNTRKQRAIMGVSAGGFGAMKIALRHPDVFGAVATHSAAILPAHPDELAGSAENIVYRYLRGGLAELLGDPIDPDKWAEQMPMGLVARRKPQQLKGLQIYFDAGTDDHYGFFEPNRNLAAAMRKNGHRFVFRPVEEGGHAWSSPKMRDNVALSLTFVGQALSGKDAVAAASGKKKAADGGK
ncbi:MAG: alpha/beta hydrolase [Planctomycetota bacterium]